MERDRDATAAEAKALAHPVRIRILQALRGEAKTNKEIAAELGTTPGATLHHINRLVDQGFIVVQAERAGRRGAREVPYLATGKTATLSFPGTSAESMSVRNAILRSGLDSYAAAPEADRFGEASYTLHLTPDRLEAFRAQLAAVVREFKDDLPGAGSDKYGFFWAGFRHTSG
ncbi:winged helix-turn-helix domain-containing protein [Arthrobacter sp. zg-Y20]|uniref:ArsR/SmtB family transcription factor n=1 Tax=unclassified Arthrobacter TaxID=235627 RepID=UPI001D14325C|nr:MULTISPECIES: winged helix-turn-helix domain-containing protein [unclassified Arthrobacter]MCC3275400.1 winged helix-turn-helix domain-containing protein [Arthrobacter sp. zg-Y20]MDK1315559.1 winged helix-turn-helix domain-containing protein [Arthrobacter sp. zg.Y20]WIB05974.1 winged helix-turn-helix domain-containing protein [Arthrobacter sp. zg-Y20]